VKGISFKEGERLRSLGGEFVKLGGGRNTKEKKTPAGGIFKSVSYGFGYWTGKKS